MPVLTHDERRHQGIVPPPARPYDGRRGDGSGDGESSFPVSKGRVGLWILLIAVIMLFAGLSSAYVVLRGVPSWQNIQLPSLLWPNTGILILSSIAIELSRRSARRNQLHQMKQWLGLSGVLGLAFLAGQLAAWQQLVKAGVYLPSTLQSSFFYILTGLHGIHLLGGIAALVAVLITGFRNRLTALKHEPLDLCATYWHFMDGLWVYLFLLLLLS